MGNDRYLMIWEDGTLWTFDELTEHTRMTHEHGTGKIIDMRANQVLIGVSDSGYKWDFIESRS